MKRLACVGFMLLCVLPLMSSAAIYRWQGKDSTHFSDRPQRGAKRVRVPELQTYEAPEAITPSVEPIPLKAPTKFRQAYSRFVIDSPQDGTTVRSAMGQVDFRYTLEPRLQGNDRVHCLVDGQVVGGAPSPDGFGVMGINRGSHQFQLRVVDGSGKVLIQSQTITVYMHNPRVNMHKTQVKPLNPPVQALHSPDLKEVKPLYHELTQPGFDRLNPPLTDLRKTS
jgi:Domain of unknown function (DUF4124)